MSCIISNKIYQNGEAYGHIDLVCNLTTYTVNVCFFGIRIPVDSVTTSNYNLALHNMTILTNKYNFDRRF